MKYYVSLQYENSETILGALPRDVLPVQGALRRVLQVFNRAALAEPATARWRNSTPHEHIFTALGHLASHLRGRRDEDHLTLATCRLLLASVRANEGV